NALTPRTATSTWSRCIEPGRPALYAAGAGGASASAPLCVTRSQREVARILPSLWLHRQGAELLLHVDARQGRNGQRHRRQGDREREADPRHGQRSLARGRIVKTAGVHHSPNAATDPAGSPAELP